MNQQAAEKTKETSAWRLNGFLGILVVAVALGFAGYLGITAFDSSTSGDVGTPWAMLMLAIMLALVALLCAKFTTLEPNEAGVVTFFGTYAGSIRSAGFHMYVPLGSLTKTTLKMMNFEVGPAKVNDADGNPIQIGAIVVIRVRDTFLANFGVEDWMQYAKIQADTAVRTLASRYPYDAGADTKAESLLGNHASVQGALIEDMQTRLDGAGLEVVDARLSHLAYAPEIASAMLRRQQAAATVMARTQIAEGAARIVEETVARLTSQHEISIDQADLSRMATNLMVVLTSEQAVVPVVDVST